MSFEKMRNYKRVKNICMFPHGTIHLGHDNAKYMRFRLLPNK